MVIKLYCSANYAVFSCELCIGKSNDDLQQLRQARISPGLNNRNFPAPAINTEGSENMVKRLVREVLKQQENISNVMEKLIVIEGKMENLCQPAITPPDNPTLMIRNLGGASVRDALKRAWYSIFSIKVMANVNWEGKPKKRSQQKQGLQDSIITAAVFAARKPDKFEMENETRKIMRGIPEKYRKNCDSEKEDEMDTGNGPVNGPQPGVQ
ncbi:hypothetical protein OUZ56_005998 [Daphnia magna]|uniref:DUF4806 domain-containing protein n=1 Tax=Daphnia magna TaxID=35525 RepID=A0ABQ9YUJ5_9CRUS|nr:hypothetical protein OUZ56_005998 [Daphnia magna]